MTKRQIIFLTLWGCCLSAMIAGVALIFLMLEQAGSHLFWETIPHTFPSLPPFAVPILLCSLGGILVYHLKQKWGPLPQTSHQRLAELKALQTVDYRLIYRDLCLSLLILILGAGVGPEAPLLGAIIAFSIWEADKLRFLKKNYSLVAQASLTKKLQYLLHPRKYLIPYPSAKKAGETAPYKKIFNTIFIINGLILFLLLMKMTDQPSFITKIGKTSWGKNELLLFLPLALYAFGFGNLYLMVKKYFFKVISALKPSLLLKTMSGAAMIGMIGIFFPNLLFSGQHSLPLAVKLGATLPILTLIGLSLLKLLFLEVCLQTGWVGGDIFPITFASLLHGFAIAQLFPAYDSLFIIATVSLTLASTLLENELLALIFISLFFPLEILPLAVVLLGLFKIKNYYLTQRGKQ